MKWAIEVVIEVSLENFAQAARRGPSLGSPAGPANAAVANWLFILVNNGWMEDKKIEALWSHLHWLIVLAEQGSYTAAAARLGVSKAAMSQHIAELERAVGIALVRRTTRSMRLTEAGQRLVDETRDPFRQIEHSFLGSRDQAGAPRG